MCNISLATLFNIVLAMGMVYFGSKIAYRVIFVFPVIEKARAKAEFWRIIRATALFAGCFGSGLAAVFLMQMG